MMMDDNNNKNNDDDYDDDDDCNNNWMFQVNAQFYQMQSTEIKTNNLSPIGIIFCDLFYQEVNPILAKPRVSTLFSVVKCKGDVPAMHRSCISRLVCIEPSVCYLSQIEHDVILCIHHYCACLSFSGGLHASGQIWP